MEIKVFSEQEIRNLHKDKKLVMIADFRRVGYNEEQSTIQGMLSRELSIPLYPICVKPNPFMVMVLIKNYIDYDYWFIDESLIKYFKKFI